MGVFWWLWIHLQTQRPIKDEQFHDQGHLVEITRYSKAKQGIINLQETLQSILSYILLLLCYIHNLNLGLKVEMLRFIWVFGLVEF